MGIDKTCGVSKKEAWKYDMVKYILVFGVPRFETHPVASKVAGKLSDGHPRTGKHLQSAA